MDQASLQELQSFRELEGLVAPRRGRSARLMSHSLASSPSLRALSPRQAGSLERREDGRQPGQLLRVQESSYVADAEFNTVRPHRFFWCTAVKPR